MRLWLKPEEWYAGSQIGLMTGTRVRAIDRAGASVLLQDGRRIGYEQIVLATGSRPKPFPADRGGALAGVHLLRGIADIDQLVPALDTAARVVVIGGGYIGLEAAAIMRKAGRAVTLIEAGPRILGRVACETTARMTRALHQQQGVDILEGTGVTALHAAPDGRIASVQIDTGHDLPADLVIVGIGALANDDLARQCGVACRDVDGGGVIVDAQCRSSDPCIYAIGDVAALVLDGRPVRLESVQNACDQARALARTLTGDPSPYAPIPWFWSDQYDMKLQIAGLNHGADQTVFRHGKRAGTGSVWYIREGRFIAIDALSDPRAYMTGKKWLEQGVMVCPNDIADPDWDLSIAV